MIAAVLSCTALSGAVAAHRALSQAGARARHETSRLADAQRRLAEAKRRRDEATAARAVMAEAGVLHLSAQDWAVRRIDMTQTTMPRVAANGLLAELRKGSAQVFHAQELDLTVLSAEDGGLFDEGGRSDDRNVQVTARGTLYFRIGAN
ncbi:hypothetical protein [Paraburkholderia heleia]|uniref:hypothetical protein n=1 Tax=Paraburkholderia heleia TaxID=634127 RepID=UPI002AB60DD7|nr:hypothetical protein [Paraburkholderia heleia]